MINVKARAFVFDAYGTLFDVHAAIARHRAEAGPDADHFSEIWRTKQLEYTWTMTLASHYIDFWALTERALDYAFARIPSVDRALRQKLLDAYLELEPYPGVSDALTELRSRGLRLAILSNGSPRMLDAAIKAARLDRLLHAIFSVDAVRAYKPRADVYALVTDGLNMAAQEVVFVSSNRWDIMGAASFGFRPIWVNRAGLPDEYAERAPIHIVASLSALPALAL
jgi:2-haloacid dehalogenase